MAYSLIYSDSYSVDIGTHVFRTSKYAAIKRRLIEEQGISEDQFLEPEPATDEQVELVHEPAFVQDMRRLRATPRTVYSELPLTREIIDGFFLFAGGSTLACREALRHGGAGIHIGGGFHHAFPDHAEGFCYVNDHCVGVRVMQHEGLINRAFILDCDLHQGNGNAVIFQNDANVFTCSLHQENNYPLKQQSDLDFGLPDGTDDELYLKTMGEVLPGKVEEFKPDLLVYVAGGDPYQFDQLGGLSLTIGGLKLRDDMVFSCCRELNIPVVSVLAGGYALEENDLYTIQYNTCLSAIEHFKN